MDLDDLDTVDELPARPRRTIPGADRELLERAARALGAVRVQDIEGEEYLILHFEDGSTANGWNPLLFSGDALELAVELRLGVNVTGGLNWTSITFFGHPGYYFKDVSAPHIKVDHGDDRLAATRRAITLAAAEIAKHME